MRWISLSEEWKWFPSEYESSSSKQTRSDATKQTWSDTIEEEYQLYQQIL